MDYIAYLHKDKTSDFGVSFPDFPGCITAGRTLEEAHKMAAEALALHMAGMQEDGEEIPEPSTLDDLANDPTREGAARRACRPSRARTSGRRAPWSSRPGRRE